MTRDKARRERNRLFLAALPVAIACPACGSDWQFWADLGLTKSPLKVAYAECLDCGTQYRLPRREPKRS